MSKIPCSLKGRVRSAATTMKSRRMASLLSVSTFWVASSSEAFTYSGDYQYYYLAYYYDPLWSVQSGACNVDLKGCIESPNYPARYESDQRCEIAVVEDTSLPLHVFGWHTEAEKDYLTVGGKSYSGSDTPRGVKATGLITWTSNDVVQGMGWKLCPYACLDKGQSLFDWTDKDFNNCTRYMSNKWCTPKGEVGTGWDASWGSISDMKMEGEFDAFQACCYCGGGDKELPATVSPENCQTVGEEGQGDGHQCVFPFTYDGTKYDRCTTVGNDGVAWCSTRTDISGKHIDGSWGNCAPACFFFVAPLESSGGKTNDPSICRTQGSAGMGPDLECKFPFTYEGMTYTGCTSLENDGKPWCSVHRDDTGMHKDGEWGECAEVCPLDEKGVEAPKSEKPPSSATTGAPSTEASCKTVRDEKACRFPFIYKEITYNECTKIGSDEPWCSTQTDAEGNHEEGQWGVCEQACPVEICKTVLEDKACIFPFIYNKVTYNECTKTGSNEPWCSTQTDAQGEHVEGQWGVCGHACPVETCRTVLDDKACTFPFIYNEVTYNECTKSSSDEPWCSTQTDSEGNYIEGQWGVCGQACPVEGCKTVDGISCKFPFTFEGTTHTQCTSRGSDEPWCSTQTDHEGNYIEGNWGLCGQACLVESSVMESAVETCKTVGDERACTFPFTYEGAVHNQCTSSGSDGPWCSTETDSEGMYIEGKWGTCGQACPVESCKTVRDEKSCKFPFIYNGATYNECTKIGSDEPWCSTQTDAEGNHEDGQWGICGEACPVEVCKTVLDGNACKFPFTYEAVTHNECTTMGSDKPWCSTQTDAEGNHEEGQWGVCGGACPVESCKTVRDEKACKFPFIYNGVTYNECTSTGSDKPWCSTQTDSQGVHTEGQWGVCGQACPLDICTTVNDGKECQFPFTYEGVTYNKCTRESSDGGAWCSTQTDVNGNYEEDQWGICGEKCPIDDSAFIKTCTAAGGKQCQFPFKYDGNTYTKCTNAGGVEEAWCSTETDSAGVHVTGQWANCGSACPTESSGCMTAETKEPCQFPFKFQGETYNQCITLFNEGKPWCSTRLDSNGNHMDGHWGDCGSDCPIWKDGTKNDVTKGSNSDSKPAMRGGDAPPPKAAPSSSEEQQQSSSGGMVLVVVIAGVALLASVLIFCFWKKAKGGFEIVMPTQYGRQYKQDGL